MKVAIIAFANIKSTPYLATYLTALKNHNCKCDVIYWDRKGLIEEIEGTNNVFAFIKKLDDKKNKLVKLWAMLRYRNYVIKIIDNGEYDKIIILTSLLAVLLNKYVIRKFRHRYVFDIRDYSYEHFGFYMNTMKLLLENSCLNVISSPGYKNFLPQCNSIVCHNVHVDSIGNYSFTKAQAPVNIIYIGTIRYADACEKFLYDIRNDSRVKFSFYGEGEDEQRIKSLCEIYKIHNVEFYGKFDPAHKQSIYEKADIIYNGYGNNTNNVKYALSNKYYECLYYKKPILVNENTEMESYSKGISFIIHNSETIVDDICKWYENIQTIEFNKICNDKLQTVINENKVFIETFLKSISLENLS